MFGELSERLASEGPRAWLDFFVHDENFWMASDGRVVLPTIEDARAFMDEFAPTVRFIELRWTDLPRVEATTRFKATVGAQGWRLVQVFAPSTGAYGASKYFELILEREVS